MALISPASQKKKKDTLKSFASIWVPMYPISLCVVQAALELLDPGDPSVTASQR
jgi:hypothetical protein